MSERPGFWLHKWSDETSQYDPKGRWQGGSECYMVDYEMWIPDSITPENEDAINSYIEAEWDRQSELQAMRDEVTRLRGALESMSGIISHQHCRTCNQFHDEAKAALTPQAGKGGEK